MSAELTDTLSWLDDLLHREVQRLRARECVTRDELQGVYISDDRVERLLAQPAAARGEQSPECDATVRLARTTPWRRLIEQLSLTRFERETLLLALAPEIDLKYETLYGYLNNDVTRRWPTRELALRLFTPSGESYAQCRHLLAPQSPLVRTGVLRTIPNPSEHPAWMAGSLVLDPTVAHFLVGGRDPAVYLTVPFRFTENAVSWSDVAIPSVVRAAMQRIPDVAANGGQRGESAASPLVVLEGRAGSAQRESTEALAYSLGMGVLHIDLATIRQPIESVRDLFATAALHQLLYGSLILIDGLDTLLDRDSEIGVPIARAIEQLVAESSHLVLLITMPERHRQIHVKCRTLRIRFEIPVAADRVQLWGDEASLYDVALPDTVRHALADRFVLTPGQIQSAFRDAVDHRALHEHPANHDAGIELSSAAETRLDTALFEAAREQTRVNVDSLTMRSATTHTWDDLVLPDTTLRQIRELSSAIQHRSVVYDDWGFAKRLARGRGLTALFSGGSGTGKTMSAAIIAKELGVDLYTIDLSSVVSKYIGETEKNLDRVFRAAHHSNAMLFFDEADALFGKRSEVKEALDRYANIEVAYLLQKLEEHEGAVILATNLSRNIDQAFSRRIQYVIEFPVPNELSRERLWRGMFPAAAPLGGDVDFPFLAKHFEIAGGDIRNVALDAAFLAAQNGRVVTMHHLVSAMARQVRKQGRTPSPADFKHYFSLITRD